MAKPKPVKCNDNTMDFNGTRCVNNLGIKRELPNDSSGTPSDDPDGEDRYGRKPVPYNTIYSSQGSADLLEREGYGAGGFSEIDTTLSWEEATKQLNFIRSAAKSPNATKAEKNIYATFTKNLKKYSDSNYKSRAGEEKSFEGLLKDAQSGNGNAMALLNNAFGEGGLSGDDGGGGAGSAYSGPVQTSTISTMDDRDVEITLNEFATEMLGRNLTKKELDKYSNKFKKQDLQAQTNLRVSNGPGEVTSMTQEKPSRENMAKDIVRSNDDYVTNTINTDVYEIMARRLGL